MDNPGDVAFAIGGLILVLWALFHLPYDMGRE